MISPAFFIEKLKKNGIDFFAGVPDSLLKSVCAFITDNFDAQHNIISANEGAAIGLAAGHYLATGKPACVYMQNSGEGNIINPLASLTDPEVYNIPVLLLIGWRGRPGIHDEPQHIKQGKVTLSLLETMGIQYAILAKEEGQAEKQIEEAFGVLNDKEVYALIIEKDTFKSYQLINVEKNGLSLSREEAIQTVAALIAEKDCIVSTTGMISRELFEFRSSNGQSHERDFLTVGSMGHASQIALGIALAKPERRVWCFDGDGAVIMHMGSMAIIGTKSPKNLVHIVFNNGAHDSVGGQPTAGLKIDLPVIAKASGYLHSFSVDNKEDLLGILDQTKTLPGPILIEIKVKKGNRKDLGRPTTTPAYNKALFMDYLKNE